MNVCAQVCPTIVMLLHYTTQKLMNTLFFSQHEIDFAAPNYLPKALLVRRPTEKSTSCFSISTNGGELPNVCVGVRRSAGRPAGSRYKLF